MKDFYYKRATSIFPSYWILFAILFMLNVHRSKVFFYHPTAGSWTILLSLIGLDGYFLYAIPNYYMIGEWFLGAIIFMYLCYPLLLYGIQKIPVRSFALVVLLYIWVAECNRFQIMQFRNLFSCLISFYIGMLLMKYRDYWDKLWLGSVCGILLIAAMYAGIPYIHGIHLPHLAGVLLFVTMFSAGERVVCLELLRNVFSYLGKISYEIFLLQHVVILRILNVLNPVTASDYWLVLALAVILTILAAAGLNYTCGKLRRLAIIRDLRVFLSEEREGHK